MEVGRLSSSMLGVKRLFLMGEHSEAMHLELFLHLLSVDGLNPPPSCYANPNNPSTCLGTLQWSLILSQPEILADGQY